MNLSFKFYSEYICSDLFFILKKTFYLSKSQLLKNHYNLLYIKKKPRKPY